MRPHASTRSQDTRLGHQLSNGSITEECSTAATRKIGGVSFRTKELITVLFASVPPETKKTASGSEIPTASETWSRANSSAFLAAAPPACALAGFPTWDRMASDTASMTTGNGAAVAFAA
jgi:hypothetical protein